MQQRAAERLATAEQLAKQMELEAAETRAAAAEKNSLRRQQVRLAQMASQQQSASQPGAPPPSQVEAAGQRSLSREVRKMAQEVGDGAVSEHLRQAAGAADAAAQAIEDKQAETARQAQALSARCLHEARRALLGDRFEDGDGTETPSAGETPTNTLLIEIPADMGQQVKAFFDSEKPTAYANQLLEYSTRLRIAPSSSPATKDARP